MITCRLRNGGEARHGLSVSFLLVPWLIVLLFACQSRDYDESTLKQQISEQATEIAQLRAEKLLVTPTMEGRATQTARVAEERLPTPTMEPTSTRAPVPTATHVPAPTNTTRPQVYRLGEKAQADGYGITANAVLDPLPAENGVPEPGMRFIAVDVTVENVGSKPITYSYADFFLRDSDGWQYVKNTVRGLDKYPYLTSGKLAPGEKVRGYMQFCVHGKATGLLLLHSNFETRTGKVRISLSESSTSQ